MKKLFFPCSVFFMFVFLFSSSAQAVTALITEVKKGKGVVEFKAPGQPEWKQVLPLHSIENETVIRATNDGFAVLLYASSGKTVKILSANSPYKVQDIRLKDDTSQKAQKIFAEAASFLAGRKTETLSAPMSVRRMQNISENIILKDAFKIISPKDTKILSERPVLEWIGPSRIVYRVTLKQGDTVIWSQENLRRTIFPYPLDKKPLEAGARYEWLVESEGYLPVVAAFTVSSQEEKADMQFLIEEAKSKASSGSLTSSSAVLQYGILASKGFYADARKVLMDSISADPDEPSLHFLLGDCYRTLGLKTLADEEFDEAQFLMQTSP